MEISQLVFLPMDADSTVQERYFEQGLLKFGSTIGPYMEKVQFRASPAQSFGDQDHL